MNTFHGPTLAELGEFAVLEKVILSTAAKYGSDGRLGDDCVFVDVGDITLAVSADVGPRPLVQQLKGYEHDHEAAGWHAAVATVSDIATSGAAPMFLVNTIDAPPDLPAEALRQFVDGYFRACHAFGFTNAGGDIRQGATLTARVFGAGLVDHGERIGRSGATAGDRLVLIGHAGRFISSFLRLERHLGASDHAELLESVRFPVPPILPMRELASAHLVNAASDSSDGVLGAIANLAQRSNCGFDLRLHEGLLEPGVMEAAHFGDYDPWNLFFFWGDWSVCACVPDARFTEFQDLAVERGFAWSELGVTTEQSGISAGLHGRRYQVNKIRNENFVTRGFNAGIRDHVEYMLSANIFQESI